jgi:hypothetical protein
MECAPTKRKISPETCKQFVNIAKTLFSIDFFCDIITPAGAKFPAERIGDSVNG